jgi:hypothetical protein
MQVNKSMRDEQDRDDDTNNMEFKGRSSLSGHPMLNNTTLLSKNRNGGAGVGGTTIYDYDRMNDSLVVNKATAAAE